jgi:hypothetical protein
VLSKLFKSLYNKVLINIVVGRSQTTVYVEECNKKIVLNAYSQSFNTLSVDDKMQEYINSFTSQSPFNYISVLDTSSSQGAIPTCSAREMPIFYNLESSKYMCYKNKWAYYTSKPDLETLQETYSQIGIDFIFSPFIILTNFFKDKIDSTLALYILLEENYVTIAVFDEARLLFAEHIDMEHNDDSDQLTMDDNGEDDIDLDLEESINLEDIDAINDIEGLDDFGDIEDLDTIDEIDEFAESDDDEEEELLEEASEVSSVYSEDFSEDYKRFLIIQSSISRFYKDERYESKFVENIYVADGVGVSGDLKKYLEEEMFLNVFIRRLDLCAEVCEIAKAELK